MRLLGSSNCDRLAGYLRRALAGHPIAEAEHPEIERFIRILEEGVAAETDAREEAFRVGARQLVRGDEGSVEVDEHAVVSEGRDGAYVQAWLWVTCEEAGLPSKYEEEDEHADDQPAE